MPTSNPAHCVLNACQNRELSGASNATGTPRISHLIKMLMHNMPPRVSSCTRTNSRTDKGGSDLGWSALLSDRNGFCRRNVSQLGLRYAATTTHVSKIRPTLSFAVIECSGAPMNETPVMSVSCRSRYK